MTLQKSTLTLVIALFATLAFTQVLPQTEAARGQTKQQDTSLRHSLGSSLFLLGNLPDIGSETPVNFGQLNYGYRLTPKSNILVEATTWTYYEPLGTYGNSEELYPGKVRAYGVGLGYQQFIWKNLYASAVATPFVQQFYNEDNQETQKGYQLYLQFITGSRWEFFKKRWFIEPAIALKYWPVNTNFPASFQEIEAGAHNYNCEPSANFGYKF